MSKRDRDDARGDETADDAAQAESAELDTPDTDDEKPAKELRPSGKRSARRGTDDADTDGDDKGSVAVKDRPKKKTDKPKRQNPFTTVWTFLQQVVAELKKVIWPTRREMILYTILVLVFVVVMTAFIAGIDIGFARLVLLIFG